MSESAAPLALIQFPDYPAADLPPLPEGWRDLSYRNDIAPRYGCAVKAVNVWLDYADRAEREDPTGARFIVWADQGNMATLCESDDWEEVLAYVEGLPVAPDLHVRVAAEFSRLIRQAFTSEEFSETNRRNATPEYSGCCASHDFCDSNDLMNQAMETCGLFTPDSLDYDTFDKTPSFAEIYVKTWNQAWDLARVSRFALAIV